MERLRARAEPHPDLRIVGALTTNDSATQPSAGTPAVGDSTELLVQDALLLRAFALQLLARQLPSESLLAFARQASDAAWHLMLAAEACAVPLAGDLSRRGADAAGLLPPRVRTLLAQAEDRERQRLMVGRWQLGRIDALAAERGLRPCVIKGGALLLDDARAVDLGDLDFLIADAEAAGMSELLRSLGMHQPLGARQRSDKHLPYFMGEGLLRVELHTELRYGRGVDGWAIDQRPMAGCRALRRWTGARATMAILLHASEMHPHRCGHLRDLLVIAEALDLLEPAERRLLDGLVDASPGGDAMREVLELVETLRASAAPVDSGRLRTIAAMKYADLLTPDSARLSRFVRHESIGRYLPLLVPWRRVAVLQLQRLHAGVRTPTWLPPVFPADSRVAHLLGGGVVVLRRATLQFLGVFEGPAARRAARRAVAAAALRLRP